MTLRLVAAVAFLSAAAAAADLNGLLERVVDGDTLRFYAGGERLTCRIAYIDAPESHANARAKRKAAACRGVALGRMTEAGRLAAEHAEKLLRRGKTYRIRILGEDRYGRSICLVALPGGGTFNEAMVDDGFAIAYRKYIPVGLLPRFERMQKAARAGKKGLWKSHTASMRCLLH